MTAEQGAREIRLKAEAYDRILEKYRELQANADFYSKNWVELAETIEREKERIRWLLEGGSK